MNNLQIPLIDLPLPKCDELSSPQYSIVLAKGEVRKGNKLFARILSVKNGVVTARVITHNRYMKGKIITFNII
jgi:hypothetical protein